MGTLAIQNFYNGKHSNVVATTTWGSYTRRPDSDRPSHTDIEHKSKTKSRQGRYR